MAKSQRKRSITIAKHRTSISLEEPFWEALRGFAEKDGRSVADLVGEIDKRRGKVPSSQAEGATVNLSAALRLYVLERIRAKS
jgi:predicted DNA-binding ribbon-helix-helix protein